VSASDGRYLALWKRMNRIVEAYSKAGRDDEADYHIADFFGCFEDPDELERHVAIAEATAKEEGVIR
jgi:hypothetical protein